MNLFSTLKILNSNWRDGMIFFFSFSQPCVFVWVHGNSLSQSCVFSWVLAAIITPTNRWLNLMLCTSINKSFKDLVSFQFQWWSFTTFLTFGTSYLVIKLEKCKIREADSWIGKKYENHGEQLMNFYLEMLEKMRCTRTKVESMRNKVGQLPPLPPYT